MGMLDKLAEGRKQKLSAYIETQLPGAGAIEATLPMTQTGNPMLTANPAGFKGVAFYGIAVTAGQVVITTYPQSSETPNGIAASFPRADVKVEKWKPKMISSKLELGTPEGTFKIDVPRIHRDDGEAVVAALGGDG